MEHSTVETIARVLKLQKQQVANTIQLLEEGNTVPFIARYRKERTHMLDEEQIRSIQDSYEYLKTLNKRRETILKSIADQGKLTPELEDKIRAVAKLQELEDLYLPYRPKKRTRATIARERGLQALADLILAQETLRGQPEEFAQPYIDPEKEIHTAQDVLNGAQDIIAETISESAEIRKAIREFVMRTGILRSQAKDPEQSTVYDLYYDYSELVKQIRSHRVLAINRGEKEKILTVKIEIEEEHAIELIARKFIREPRSIFTGCLTQAIQDGYKRLIYPAIEREVRHTLSEMGENQAIRVFATNLKNLLLQAPLNGKIIMGIDPGFRTGCKVAVIDTTGKYLEGITIYPHPPQKRSAEALRQLGTLVERHAVEVIAIGNGTASRETETLVAELIQSLSARRTLAYTIVSEAGASVYSASPIAQLEFPDLEASMRGNISIARRLLDPLAELVKIDPKSIGVGQYQHDVNQSQLAHTLQSVVEDCVNHVGVDLNTASVSLLTYVAGLNRRNAQNIVQFREENGPFPDRESLKNVSGIGANTFEQAAGFLRIPNGDNPLDNTSIHPESYDVTRQLLAKFQIDDIHAGGKMVSRKISAALSSLRDLSRELEVGLPTLEDIIANLEKPGRDPRQELPAPILKSDVLTIEDIRPGMILNGTVRNVVDFGAFVDIGLKQDGLVHISEMANRFIKNPHEVVAVGDVIKVRILSVDIERSRIGLSMKELGNA